MNKAIKKIELDLGGKIISLTPKQAQNLKDALDELFGKEIVKIIEKEKEYIPYPQPYPQPYPVYPRRPIWEWEPYRYGRITCGNDLDTASNLIGANYCSSSGTLRLTG